MGYQVAATILMVLFYFVYFLKMCLQKRRGIQTNRMGKGEKPKKTRWIEMVLQVFVCVIIPVELCSIAWKTMWGFPSALRTFGLIVAFFGVLVFLMAVITMRDSWRAGIDGSQKTKLVCSGIYRLSRNPAFLGFDLLYIGIFLSFANAIHLFFVLAAMVMLHLQILQEEKFLQTAFGEPYCLYKKNTARYFSPF